MEGVSRPPMYLEDTDVYGEELPQYARENTTISYLAATKDFEHYKKLGRLTDPTVDDRDVLLFPEKVKGKYVRVSRPKYKDAGVKMPSVWISYGEDLLCYEAPQLLITGEQWWEEQRIGAGTPPIRTEEGWLELIHGVQNTFVGWRYSLGAVLLDLVMPGMDGLEVLRALARRRGRPVVVVTSQVSHQGVVKCALSLGASYYLVKPVNCQALPELLQFLCLTPLKRAAMDLLDQMGAAGLGMEAAARAAAVLHENPHALLKEAYAPTITDQRTSYASVEKNIRAMVDKLQAGASPAYISLMGGLPPQRPSNLVFLRHLAQALDL